MTIEMKKTNRKESDKYSKAMIIVSNLEENPGFLDNSTTGGYACKKCKKRFKSFQALGGHQGIHKKIKVGDQEDVLCLLSLNIVPTVLSSGLHRCKMCTKEFETGQALGGHMRLHRLEKGLNVIDQKEGLWWQKAAVEKKESDFMLTAVGVQRLNAEEDERISVRRELILAGKELRLCL